MLQRIWLFLLVTTLLLSCSACGKKPAEQPAPVEKLVTDPITLIDEEALVVRVLKIEPENEAGYTVSVMVWNRTDMDLKFFFDNLEVNDLLYGERFQLDVEAGQKRLQRITLDSDRLNNFGLMKVTKVGFRFYAKHSDPLYDDHFFDQTLSIFPLGEAAYKTYQRIPAKTDVTLIDNEYCTVTFVEDVSNDTDLICTLYVVNKTDKRLLLVGEKITINNTGKLYKELSMQAGTKSYQTVFLPKDLAKVDSIEAIQSLTADIKIYDSAHFADGPFATVSVSVP